MNWLTVVLWCLTATFVFLAAREAHTRLQRTPHGRSLDVGRYLVYLLLVCVLGGPALRLTFNDSFLVVVLLWIGALGAITLLASIIVERFSTARMGPVILAAIIATVGAGLGGFLLQ